MTRTLLAMTVIAAVLLVACGTGPAQPAGGGQVTGSTGGQELFATNCGECHSEDGTGTDEAPAVLGHTTDQVLKQVRTPAGDMEAVPAGKLPDADLALIANYVASLGGQEAHAEDVKPAEEESVHLTAAYQAIKDYEAMDRETAINHLDQAVALASGEAAELYEEMIGAIKGGKAGNARHELKELLGLVAEAP